MAEEKKKGKGLPSTSEAIGEFAKIIGTLLLIAIILGKIAAFLGGLSEQVSVAIHGPRFDAGSTPVGSQISLSESTQVLDAPGGKVIGEQPAGATGVVLKGPIFKDGERYWYVDFASGPDGWVSESTLLQGNGAPFDPGDTPIGGRASVQGETSVFGSPGGDIIGSQPAGAIGTVSDGPIYKDGQRWWYVDFDSGPDGWVAEKDLRAEDGSAFDPGDTPIGSDVLMKGKVDIFDAPGGKKIGTQASQAIGTVAGGPVMYGTERWWYVDFDKSPDGWVPESMLSPAPSINPGSTPVGGRIETKSETEVLGAPGGEVTGMQPAGAAGRVTKGPEWKDGVRYWYVDFDSGPDGWVAEGALANEDGSAFSGGKTPVGSVISTGNNTVVYDAPSGEIVGGQPTGATGTVAKGPVYKDGQRWWYVDFESGPDGWVAEKDLRAEDGGAFGPGDTPIGSDVQSKREADVFDEHGKKIGTQEQGVRGVITDGPIWRDGQRYWYVDFESGPDGWVAEKDLSPYKEPGVVTRIARSVLHLLTILAWIVGSVLFVGLVVIIRRTNKVAALLNEGIAIPKGARIEVPEENSQWKRVMDLSESENPSDWKLAIIEADAMLDKMLVGMNYPGATAGERLKAVEQSDFNTLDSAWEAHKVRNRIAHEGADFLITGRETRRVIGLYRKVFEEFRLI